MFTGTTINELFDMVERAEEKAEAVQMHEELSRYAAPTLNIYSFEQFKEMEREIALVGVA